MKGLCISDTLTLPLDWITLSTVVYGARGAGKTTLGRVVAEEAHAAGQRFCAIDLKGDWWGLKAGTDGAEGLPVVIFGGDHADVPLEPEAGLFVADTVVALHQSVILDFENLSKGKQLRFLAAFFERLYDRNRDPLLLLLDEAQRYAAQRPMTPEATLCLGAVEDLVKLGRKHGVGPVLFTQRGSGLNKEVSELCDMLVAFRTPGPLDQGRVRDWLDANVTADQAKTVMGRLSGMSTGTAVFASGHPGLKVFQEAAVRRPVTFDSSATPRIGSRPKTPGRMAQVDLEAIKTRMADAIERAKADDPKELRRRIAELERTLAATQNRPTVAPEVRIERVEVEVVPKETLDRWLAGVLELRQTIEDLEAAASAPGLRGISNQMIEALNRVAATPRSSVAAIPAAETAPARVESPQVASGNLPRTSGAPRPLGSQSSDGRGRSERVAERSGVPPSIGKAERAFLSALATHRGGLTQSQLSLITGYSAKSGHFANVLGRLRAAGLIETGWPSRITDAGREAVGEVDALPQPGPELVDWWLGRVGKAERAMLEVFVQEYPRPVAREDLGERAGYSPTSGHFANVLGRLRTLSLVDGWRASDDLMGGA